MGVIESMNELTRYESPVFSGSLKKFTPVHIHVGYAVINNGEIAWLLIKNLDLGCNNSLCITSYSWGNWEG